MSDIAYIANEDEDWTVELDTFPTRLWAARMRRGWSKLELSEKSGIPNSNLGQWESGTQPRDKAAAVQAVAAATGCDAAWLMWGDSGPGFRTGSK